MRSMRNSDKLNQNPYMHRLSNQQKCFAVVSKELLHIGEEQGMHLQTQEISACHINYVWFDTHWECYLILVWHFSELQRLNLFKKNETFGFLNETFLTNWSCCRFCGLMIVQKGWSLKWI